MPKQYDVFMILDPQGRPILATKTQGMAEAIDVVSWMYKIPQDQLDEYGYKLQQYKLTTDGEPLTITEALSLINNDKDDNSDKG